MLKTFTATLALILSFASIAVAQTPQVETGKVFTVQADHDGANTTHYTVDIDGTQVGTAPVGALSAGVITFANLSVSVRGAHNLVVIAHNEDGFAASDPLAFNAIRPRPNKPGKPRFVTGMVAVLKAPAKAVGLLARALGLAREAKGGSSFNVRIIQEG